MEIPSDPRVPPPGAGVFHVVGGFGLRPSLPTHVRIVSRGAEPPGPPTVRCVRLGKVTESGFEVSLVTPGGAGVSVFRDPFGEVGFGFDLGTLGGGAGLPCWVESGGQGCGVVAVGS